MNHDDNFKKNISPELEARVVAWILGEASPFEAAELTRLAAENPELMAFKQSLEAMHGLVGEAARPPREPLVLAPERRAKLLAVIGGAQPSGIAAPAAMLPARSRRPRWQHWWTVGLAACATLGIFLLTRPAFKMVTPNPASLSVEPNEPTPRTRGSDQAGAKEQSVKVNPESVAMPATSAPAPVAQPVASDYDLDAFKAKNEGRQESARLRGLLREGPALAGAGGNFQRPNGTEKLTFGVRGAARDEKKTGGSTGTPSSPDAIADYAAPVAPVDAAMASNEPIALSPFEVKAEPDSGYVAQDTLAGSRIRTDLKDLASPLTVVTKQFLDDTRAKSDSATMNYSAVTGGAAPALGKTAGKPADPDLPVLHPAPAPPIFDESLRAELSASAQPFSTFSLHVSDVSFQLARAALGRGERPDPATIRPEEFYNAFDYGDPAPAAGEAVSCHVEQAAHPFLQQRNLVRIALKIPATGRSASQPLRLTILLDTSGSMEREDRAASVRSAMTVLASLLGPADRVTLIGFARQPHLLADRVPGDQAAKLVAIIGRTPAEGGTNLEEALKLAGEHARADFSTDAQNRIVILSDGAANLGNDDPAALAARVETLRQQGIALDACGIGADGLDDSILEALTRKGDGRYYVINSPAEADANFARQLAGAFRPAAKNVKVQVRFNPARVKSYRLIGFEQHRLRTEDFRNDQVDAAELAADEAAVAVYQVEALPEGEGELGDVFVRFRNTGTNEMVERSWTLAYHAQAPAFDRATPSMQLAGIAALLAEKLRGGPIGDQIRLAELAPVVNALRGHYAHEARVQELVTMFAQARRLTGE